MEAETGLVVEAIQAAHEATLDLKFILAYNYLSDAIHLVQSDPQKHVDSYVGPYTLCRLHAIYFTNKDGASDCRDLVLRLLCLLFARSIYLKYTSHQEQNTNSKDKFKVSVTTSFIDAFQNCIRVDPTASLNFDLTLKDKNNVNKISMVAIPVESVYTHSNPLIRKECIYSLPIFGISQYHMLLSLLSDDSTSVKLTSLNKILIFLKQQGMLVEPPLVNIPNILDTDIEAEKYITVEHIPPIVLSKKDLTNRDLIKFQLARSAFIKICALIEDKDIHVRTEASKALANFGIPYLIKTLLQALIKIPINVDDNGVIKKVDSKAYHFYLEESNISSFVRSLPGNDETLPLFGTLTMGIEDEYTSVRLAALDSIFSLSYSNRQFFNEALPILIDMFNDEQSNVRLASIWYLYLCGLKYKLNIPYSQLEVLMSALNDDIASIRVCAYKLIGSLNSIIPDETNKQQSAFLTLVTMVMSHMVTHIADINHAYKCLANIGCQFAQQIKYDDIKVILNLNSNFLAQEQRIENKEHFGYLILLANACIVNKELENILPQYVKNRFDLIRLQSADMLIANNLTKKREYALIENKPSTKIETDLNSQLKKTSFIIKNFLFVGGFKESQKYLTTLIKDIIDSILFYSDGVVSYENDLIISKLRLTLSFLLCYRWTLDIIRFLTNSQEYTSKIKLSIRKLYYLASYSTTLYSGKDYITYIFSIFLNLVYLFSIKNTVSDSEYETKCASVCMEIESFKEIVNIEVNENLLPNKDYVFYRILHILIGFLPFDELKIEGFNRISVAKINIKPECGIREKIKSVDNTMDLAKDNASVLTLLNKKNRNKNTYYMRGDHIRKYGVDIDTYYTNVKEIFEVGDNFDQVYAEKRGLVELLKTNPEEIINSESKMHGSFFLNNLYNDYAYCGYDGNNMNSFFNYDLDTFNKNNNNETKNGPLHISDYIFLDVTFPIVISVEIHITGTKTSQNINEIMKPCLNNFYIILKHGSQSKDVIDKVSIEDWKMIDLHDVKNESLKVTYEGCINYKLSSDKCEINTGDAICIESVLGFRQSTNRFFRNAIEDPVLSGSSGSFLSLDGSLSPLWPLRVGPSACMWVAVA